MPIRIAIADQRRLVREALGVLINDHHGDFKVTALASEVQDAVDRSDPADVLLVGHVADQATGGLAFLGAIVHLSDHSRWYELLDALRAPGPAARSESSRTTPTLSRREARILTLISEGRTPVEIGDMLGISARTVERHTQSAMAKLGVRSKAHAVARSLQLNLLNDAG